MSAEALVLPTPLEAHEPPEARGLARDEVRMLVSEGDGSIEHARVRDLPRFLESGDLLVVNTSRTLPAALDATLPDGTRLELHLSTPVRGAEGLWFAELRYEGRRYRRGQAGDALELAAGGSVELRAREVTHGRLWICALRLPEPLFDYLERHGRPIQYGHIRGNWPLGAYQTAFAHEPGSAEMPSAGRPLTPELTAALIAHGVLLAPVVLHTGVSSLELGERPYPERYRVPATTARLATAARRWGGRVIAVGTTVVRALETVAHPDGTVHAGEGWTELVLTPERGMYAVDGLLTGWHERDSSHLLILDALAGRERVERTYSVAVAEGYRWHEFGDSHLLLR